MAKNDYAVAPSSWIDSLGTTVSIACAIQCSVFPLLVGVLPLCRDFSHSSGQQFYLGIPLSPTFSRFCFSCLGRGVDQLRTLLG